MQQGCQLGNLDGESVGELGPVGWEGGEGGEITDLGSFRS